MEVTTTSLIEVQNAVSRFEIAEGYFSDILNTQLYTFSTIIIVLTSIYFIWNIKASRDEIKKVVGDEIEKMKKNVGDGIQTQFSKQTLEVAILAGEINRVSASSYESQKLFSKAALAWTKAAERYFFAKDENRARFCLSSARSSIEKTKSTRLLEVVGEIQSLLEKINSGKFKIEKDLLENRIKEKLMEER